MLFRSVGVQEVVVTLDGDTAVVVFAMVVGVVADGSGPLENFIGRVEKLDPERQKVKLTVSMFGRDTPVELDFIQVQKL